jgi:hypothetical protein
MDVFKTALPTFYVGNDHVDAVAKPLVAQGYAPQQAQKGVTVKADSANTGVLYVGRHNVSTDSGFLLRKGEEVTIQTEFPSDVYVVSDAGGADYSWIAQ